MKSHKKDWNRIKGKDEDGDHEVFEIDTNGGGRKGTHPIRLSTR